MNRKSKYLTERQMAVLAALKSASGEWLTARQIGEIMYPDLPPSGSEIGAIGCTLIHLPEKCDGVEKQKDGARSVYRWTGDSDGETATVVRPTPRCCTMPQKSITKSDAFASELVSDSQLISEALLHYATTMIGKNPNAALRCAYLAGRGEFGPVTTVKSQPVAKSVKPVIEKKPEHVGFTEIAVMPDDMDYETFVEEAAKAYSRCEFTYPEAARAAGISEDYFRKIVNGDAMPTRDTLMRVYYAIFSR